MNTEQKAKAYDEALEKAKKLYEQGTITESLSYVFPELRESEDERIRKMCMEYLDRWYQHCSFADDRKNIEKCITWLEKQGEHNPYSGVSFEYNGHTWGMCARDNGVDILLDKQLFQHLEKQETSYTKKDVDDAYVEGIAFAKNEIEKQYEANYQIRKDIATFIFNYRGDIKDRAKWMDYLGIKVSFVGEQGEQKPADMVEPKFHEGDILKHNKANIICKVISVNSGSYYVENIKTNGRIELFNAEQNFHLWTIQDAKDGDVLYSLDSKQPFIFKHRKPNEQAAVYCGINIYGKFFIGNTKDCVITTDKYIPSDKFQRDLLFKKMQKAGYEWDAEKKELKKIHIIDEGKAEMDYCFTRMMNGEKVSPDWSEEDEYWRQKAVDFIKHPDLIRATPTLAKSTIDWLKSVKERITWNPSKEQMDALEEAMYQVGILTPLGSKINDLCEQLKKLK